MIKLFRDPVGVFTRRWTGLCERLHFAAKSDYKAAGYWKYRHEKYGFDLRGVGDKSISHEENVKLLDQGSQVFLDVCRKANVVFDQTRVLDIGCGTGHFAEILRNEGIMDYLGIDIADTLFHELRAKFPGFRFHQVDISTESLKETYDLILALDVLQHIVNEKKFAFALDNIKSHISPSGTIIISTQFGSNRLESFYFIRRPLDVFRNAFPDFTISEPVKYADSFVFSLRKNRQHDSKTISL